jgi:hypothetical protein
MAQWYRFTRLTRTLYHGILYEFAVDLGQLRIEA